MLSGKQRLAAAVLALAVTAALIGVAVLGTGGTAGVEGDAGGARRSQSDSDCGALPDSSFGRPPNRPHTGQYVNATYGYAVTIPPALTGYTRAAAAQRGFGILLSRSPPARLSVDAAYDVFYDITPAGVHRRDSVGARLFDRLLSDESMQLSLAGVPAGRYRMRVQCPGSPRIYIHEQVIAVRDREIYRIDLHTVPARLTDDARLLDELVASWRWIAVRP